MMMFRALSVLILIQLTLASCAPDPSAIARSAGMSRQIVQTKPFALTAFVRERDPALPVTLYIEGDGRAWQSREQPSLDPTPRRALGLSLAGIDPSANVIYLARPSSLRKTPPVMFPTGRINVLHRK